MNLMGRLITQGSRMEMNRMNSHTQKNHIETNSPIQKNRMNRPVIQKAAMETSPMNRAAIQKAAMETSHTLKTATQRMAMRMNRMSRQAMSMTVTGI